MKDNNFCTMYTKGPFGMRRTVVRLHDHGRMQYAQYTAAPFVTYTEKGKRTKKRMVEGYKPYMLVIKGEGPAVPELFMPPQITGNGTEFKECRYTSFDPAITTDFDAIINPLIADGTVKVVADYRANQD